MTIILNERPKDAIFVWRDLDAVGVKFCDVGDETAEFILTAEEALEFGEMLVRVAKVALDEING